MMHGDTSDMGRVERSMRDGGHDNVVGEKGMPWKGDPGSQRMARQGDGAMDTMVKWRKGSKKM